MQRQVSLTQPQRLAALVLDLLLVGAACIFLFGTVWPPLGDKGFWAYSALLAVLVGSRLVTPFYVKPVDAISYAVPAFVSLMLLNRWRSWVPNEKWSFALAAGFSALILLLAVINITSNSIAKEWAKRLSNRIRLILDLVAHPEFIYTPLILFAVFWFHSDSWIEAVVICIVTGATVWWSAGTYAVGAAYRIGRSFGTPRVTETAAEIVGFQEPGIVLLRQEHERDIQKGDLLYIHDKHAPKKLVVAINHVGRSEGILVRAVTIKELSEGGQNLVGDSTLDEAAYRIDSNTLSEILEMEGIAPDAHRTVVGLVAPDTTIETLYFEVTDGSELEAGRLVSAQVSDAMVLYQIIGGVTKEEVVQQKNTYGYLRGQAQQIGVWNDEERRFTHSNWLPNLNVPVRLAHRAAYRIEWDSIGHFPGTDYHAKVKSISDLVTHNTAILGILGIGKSMLAIELVERMLAANIKVICLDLTDQYANELVDFYDRVHEEECLGKLQQASEKDREIAVDQPERGGSLPHLREAIHKDLSEFLDANNPRKLKIYDPAAFVASKQTHEPRSYRDEAGDWVRSAALWTVTPVEITQLVTEAALDLVSDRMSATARVCLVYEEAHALVPEWNSVVSESDKLATSGTARAILQGRKYGLGCLLVTQRTANVTKTILNQCNTVFAMRIFDETGKEFLANYIGKAYAESLSSLSERHAVLYGKASRCENPILIRLNDREEFRRGFRQEFPPPALPRDDGPQGEPEQGDDTPF